jgi:hypothetical protein
VGSTANPKALHCGLHGLPIGDYFLAGFNENETSGRLDLWKCWRYCTVSAPLFSILLMVFVMGGLDDGGDLG